MFVIKGGRSIHPCLRELTDPTEVWVTTPLDRTGPSAAPSRGHVWFSVLWRSSLPERSHSKPFH